MTIKRQIEVMKKEMEHYTDIIKKVQIGERIKAIREDCNLTQDELGALCGTTKQTIFKYESGIVTNIPLSRLEQIAQALNTTPAYLMGWESEKTTPAPEITPEEMELLELFRNAPPEKQAAIRALLK